MEFEIRVELGGVEVLGGRAVVARACVCLLSSVESWLVRSPR